MDPRMSPLMILNPVIRFRESMLEDGQFTLLNNDEDRANFILNKMIEYGIDDYTSSPQETKDALKSERFRGLANQFFSNNAAALKSSFDLYCKSILYAPVGTKELSLAYANRSAVLFKAKFYEDCLTDIERALANDYPVELQGKLFIRKAKCLYALRGELDSKVTEALADAKKSVAILAVDDNTRRKVEETLDDHEKITSVDRAVRKLASTSYVPKLPEENPELPGASSAVTMKYSQKYGRHIVATRDIKPGEILGLQKPYVTMISTESIYIACGYCNKKTWTGIPCDNCVHVMYCSEGCKQAAWREYHDVECPILAVALANNMNAHERLGTRMTIVAFKEAGSLEALRKRVKKLASITDEEEKINITVKPNSYDAIYLMDDNSDKKTAGELIHWASNSVFITFCMAGLTNFVDERIPGSFKRLRDKEWFAFVAGIIARNIKIIKVHGFTLAPPPEAELYSPKIRAIVPIQTIFNHSCYAQVRLHYYQPFTAIITASPFKEGEQVFLNYGPNFKEVSREMRLKFLQEEFHFTCDCLACVENWSSCPSISDVGLTESAMQELSAAKSVVRRVVTTGRQPEEVALKNIADLAEAIEKYYQHVPFPCDELISILEYMTIVYHDLESEWMALDE